MTIIAPALASALYDYEWLQSAVARWMHKRNLTGDIPDFIMLAEVRIKALLEARFQVLTGTVQTVAGTQYANWPSSLLRAKSVSIPGSVSNLEFVSLDYMNHNYDPATVGCPEVYTLVGDLIYFGPTPDAVYTVAYAAQTTIEPLSDSVTTNGLLNRWPNVYLWATLKEAARFCRDPQMELDYDASFQEAITAVNIVEWHAGGPLRQRSDVRPV